MKTEVNSKSRSLDGFWQFLIDPAGNGEQSGKYQMPEIANKNFMIDRNILNYRPIVVPGSWSQLPEMKWYREKFWYIKNFEWRKTAGERDFIRFEAVCYHAKVWLNGVLLGVHEGAYTPFEFEVTDSLRNGANYLAVKVDPVPGPNSTIPVQGWFCHPGIIRSVSIFTTPSFRLSSIRVIAKLDEHNRNSAVTIDVELDGEAPCGELKVKILDSSGNCVGEVAGGVKGPQNQLRLDLKLPKLWSPESPNLYQAEVELDAPRGPQTESVSFGIRRFEIKPDGFYLNGQKVFLKGAGLHAMYPGLGHTIPDEIYRSDYAMMKKAGMNSVRLVHYPHDRRALDLADAMGLLVWEEIPLYWNAKKSQECTRQSALSQLREMIRRDWNHPCIFAWGLGNEIPTSDPDSVSFFKEARELTAALDPSRAASFIDNRAVPEDGNPAMRYADFIACNIYKGWYDPDLDSMPATLDLIANNFPDRPILMTEFGAGSVRGHHGGADVPWTEEYQARVLKENIGYFKKHPRVGGCFIWCWADFEDPTRLDNIFERGTNNKGVVDAVRMPKAAYETVAKLFGEERVS